MDATDNNDSQAYLEIENLLRLSDEQLKRDYLNYLVKPEFQAKTVRLYDYVFDRNIEIRNSLVTNIYERVATALGKIILFFLCLLPLCLEWFV